MSGFMKKVKEKADDAAATAAARQHYRVKHLFARDSGTKLSAILNENWAQGWDFVFMVSHKDDIYLTFEKRNHGPHSAVEPSAVPPPPAVGVVAERTHHDPHR